MPSTASPVVTVEEVLMLSKGKSPVRINQRPSKSIPRFLPAKLLVNVMLFSLWMLADTRNEAAYITWPGQIDMVCQAKIPALRPNDVLGEAHHFSEHA